MTSFQEQLQQILRDREVKKLTEKEEAVQAEINHRLYVQSEKQKSEAELQAFLALQKKLHDMLETLGAESVLRQIQRTLTYEYKGKIRRYEGPHRSKEPSEKDAEIFKKAKVQDHDISYELYQKVDKVEEGVYLTRSTDVVVSSTYNGSAGAGGGTYSNRYGQGTEKIGIWVHASRTSPNEIKIIAGYPGADFFQYDPSRPIAEARSRIEEQLLHALK